MGNVLRRITTLLSMIQVVHRYSAKEQVKEKSSSLLENILLKVSRGTFVDLAHSNLELKLSR